MPIEGMHIVGALCGRMSFPFVFLLANPTTCFKAFLIKMSHNCINCIPWYFLVVLLSDFLVHSSIA